jgi:small subunit ribosomal protein S20
MPSNKPARVSERRRARNAPMRSKAKTFITKSRKLITDDDIEGAKVAVNDAVVALDKAAQKGAIHPNNAARRKSRIMRQLSKATNK